MEPSIDLSAALDAFRSWSSSLTDWENGVLPYVVGALGAILVPLLIFWAYKFIHWALFESVTDPGPMPWEE